MPMRLSRRAFLRTTIAAAGAVAFAHTATAAAPARKPNVLIILADDLGYADLGAQGCKDIPTPHCDSIAAEGVRLTSGYVSHPFCSPTRAGLMTGRYQQRFGHENNPPYVPADGKIGLPLTETLLPAVMKQCGYVTGLVGKWHLGAAPPLHPMRRGFDEFYGFIGGGHDYFKTATAEKHAEYTVPIDRNGKPEAMEGYLTEALGREAAAFIDRHKAEPFFLYLAFNAPHTPLQSPPAVLERVKGVSGETRRKYAALVVAMDDAVGVVLAKLKAAGLDRDTLVFFLSDNGGPTRVTNASNAPLQGEKGRVFEGGIRVPFFVRWTGRLPAGRTYDEPVISLDIFPTAVAAAGGTPPAAPALDGVNVLPFLEGKAPGAPHARLFWRTGGGVTWAVREGKHKLIRIKGEPDKLFDLQADIGEAADLAAAQPQVAERLAKALDEWNSQLVPPVFEGLRPAAKKKAGAK